MAARKKQNYSVLLSALLAVLILFVGAYVYANVLPYQLSPQWEVTHEELNISGQYDPSEQTGEFLGQKVTSYEVPENKEMETAVLGDNDAGNKRIEVDLTNQRVYAFEEDNKVMEFIVSTGKWRKTPTGTFNIAYKTRAQKMSGGSRELGTYYYLPNVQFVQFFGNNEIPWSRGFSFHGTYWHSNFGTPMSHGCINMRNEDAEKLYYWSSPSVGDKRILKASDDNPGTKVIIYGKSPPS